MPSAGTRSIDVVPPVSVELTQDDGTALGTARDRLVLGLVSLVLLVVGLLAAAAGLGAVRTVGLYVFCTLGLGAALWQLEPRLRLASRVLLSAATSFTVLVLVSAGMELAGSWHPRIAFAVVTVVAVALHVVGLRRALADRRAAPRQSSPRRAAAPAAQDLPAGIGTYAQVLLALLGAVLCLVAALTHRHLEPVFGGFPTQIGPLWWIGLVLTVAAVVLLGRDDRQLALSVLLLVAILTVTPTLVYDGPRSQSSAKHADLVQQIRTLGRAESRLGIYNSWAGFFSAIAWLCDVAGIRDPMVLARFWPALLAPVRVLALRQLFARLLPSGGRIVWVAVVLAVLADPLGADYFSPQSLGFVLGLTVYGLVLAEGRRWQRLTLVLAIGCALAVSHQLSPYVVGGVLAVLVVLRQIKPWWTPALVLGPAIAWALVNFGDVSGFLDFSSFGNIANFRPPETDASVGLARLPIVGWTVRALAGGLLVLGLLAAWTWFTALVRSRHSPDRRRIVLRLLALAASSGVGLALVAANPYGQEGIFRAVLFAVPWLASLAAWPLHRSGWLRGRVPLAAVSLVMTGTFLVASFGLDRINVVRQGDVRVLDYLNAQAGSGPEGSQLVLVLLAGDLPTSAGREGVDQALVSYDALDVGSNLTSLPPAQQEAELTKGAATFAQANNAGQLYVLWSPTSAAYSRAYGLQTFEQSAQLRDAFSGDSRWETVASDQGTVLFRYRG